jgi:carboxymethylenebutenolidase
MCWEKDCGGGVPGRRRFLVGGTAFFGLGALAPRGAGQERPAPPTRVLDDPDVRRDKVTFPTAGGKEIDGFLARPKAGGKYPAVLVIAGNRITEEYIPNTCAALAKAGFVGLAPNIFHPLPDSARTPAEMQKALAGRTDEDVLRDVRAGADYLGTVDFVKGGGLGVVGFCFGGRIALLFADRTPAVKAVVAYHPGRVKPEEVARVKAPVQIHHGTGDRAVAHTASQGLEKALRAQGTTVELFLYEGRGHGFLAYTRPTYDTEAAQLSWRRTVDFLGRLR